MSIKAGLHSVAALASLPAGTLLPVAASAPQGPQEPKLLFHPTYQQRLGDLMPGSGKGWLPTPAAGAIWDVGIASPVAARAQTGAGLAFRDMPWGCSFPETSRWVVCGVTAEQCQYLVCGVHILPPKTAQSPNHSLSTAPRGAGVPLGVSGVEDKSLSAMNVAK